MNSLTSAGGVGALLQIADHTTGKTYLPCYDGNGNIVSLLNAASGAVAASYEYSPFGQPLRAQTLDATVADNPWRFSTKWTDLETGLVYYGRRYYDPKNGRFINRDPIEETGGLNLYGFVGNNPVNRWDYLGMCAGKPLCCRKPQDEGGSGALASCLTDPPSEGDPVPEPEEDLSYMGDYGPDDYDPFAPTLNDYELELRQEQEAARQAEFEATLAALNAGFAPALAAVGAGLASDNANAFTNMLNGGLEGLSSAWGEGTAGVTARAMEQGLASYGNSNLPALVTGSVITGVFQSALPPTMTIPAASHWGHLSNEQVAGATGSAFDNAHAWAAKNNTGVSALEAGFAEMGKTVNPGNLVGLGGIIAGVGAGATLLAVVAPAVIQTTELALTSLAAGEGAGSGAGAGYVVSAIPGGSGWAGVLTVEQAAATTVAALPTVGTRIMAAAAATGVGGAAVDAAITVANMPATLGMPSIGTAAGVAKDYVVEKYSELTHSPNP